MIIAAGVEEKKKSKRKLLNTPLDILGSINCPIESDGVKFDTSKVLVVPDGHWTTLGQS